MAAVARKIIVNGSVYYGHITGIERVAQITLSALDEIAKKGEIELVVPKNAWKVPKFNNIDVVVINKKIGLLTKWHHWDFQNYVRKQNGIPLDFGNVMPCFTPGISYLHDIYYKLFPQNFRTIREKLICFFTCAMYKRIAKRALRIVAVSEYTKKTIVDNYNVNPNRISVIYNGLDPCLFDIEPDNSIFERFPELKTKPFFFTLGSLETRKNLKWIASHAELYPNDFFAISGKPPLKKSSISELAKLKSLKNVLLLGYLSDQQVKALILKCKAFIFPSFFEGFGLPPLEALCYGKDVIISNNSSLPEIYKNSARYINPNDPNVDLDALLETKVDAPDDLLQRLTCKNSAKKLYEVIKEVSGGANIEEKDSVVPSPLISIITITYNNAAGLKKTIDSVASQTFFNYEHIIIDGGSSDGSVEVIKNALKDENYARHVSFWCSEKDGGIYPAMNKGVEKANGDYCLMLNSGDWLAGPKNLERAAAFGLKEDIVYCDAYFVKRGRRRHVRYVKKLTGSFFFVRGLCHQATFIKTSLQKKNLYSNEYKIVNDSDFFMKVLIKQNCSSRHLPIVLSCYDAETGFSSVSGSLHDKEFSMLLNKYYPARVQEDLRAYVKHKYWLLFLCRKIKRMLIQLYERH